MDTRREFIRKASLISGGIGLMPLLHPSIKKALAIDPEPGSSFYDAEHIVFLMQENRSFDHAFGTLQGVRGFNDPRAIRQANGNEVWVQSGKTGESYAPFHLDIKNTRATWMESLPHTWTDQVDASNRGRHDQWIASKHSGNKAYASMPLTMGYYTREDIPFYYALADAFTICDQHFCSSLTGTTPNRLYFWTGTIREGGSGESMAHVWNGDADYQHAVSWKTFPERLEDAGISWKIYQNEINLPVGFRGDEEAWLSNFGDNPMEYFSQYRVRFSPEFMANLPAAAKALEEEKSKQEKLLATADPASPEAANIKLQIKNLELALAENAHDRQVYTPANYQALSQREKNIFEKAFCTNRKDPDFHRLTTLRYMDGSAEREVQVPAGDLLYQFRKDVENNELPTVSWLVAPENFSDHPSAAWYGAWYISEVMDILTRNPEVWQKTIFVLTYDENDGYFDHFPPFTAPFGEGSGKVSAGIDPSLEFVSKGQQSSEPEDIREHCIGLGFRVPLLIASPWTRGGWVCSEVFDHSSSLLFLENFLSRKTGTKITETNISAWRRTVCGDLSSAFRPWSGEKADMAGFIARDPFVESIYNAKFKKLPDNFRPLSPGQIEKVNKEGRASGLLPLQERGIRSSCALPYELYVDGVFNPAQHTVDIRFAAGKQAFGENSAGSPFHVYAPGPYQGEKMKARAYAVTAGDQLQDSWALGDFDQDIYHLQVYGPNGFFREFRGNAKDPRVDISCGYEKKSMGSQALTGNIELKLTNQGAQSLTVVISDKSYKTGMREILLPGQSKKGFDQTIVINLKSSYCWYDFSVTIKGFPEFEKRFAGRVETGQAGMTDPAMGH